jgi:hypothetical protein
VAGATQRYGAPRWVVPMECIYVYMYIDNSMIQKGGK